MAILEEGINGGFTGKVGTVVGYQLNGKWVIRSLPKSSRKNKAGTNKQHKCRSKFSQMQHFLSSTLGFIRVGFNLEAHARQMSAHNAAKSYNMLHAFDDDGAINYAKVRLTHGTLPEPENMGLQITSEGFLFTWSNSFGENTERAYDQVMLMAYNEEKGKAFYEVSGARRQFGQEKLVIPEHDMGDHYHTWMAFISDSRNEISNSVYLGQMELTNP